MFQTSVQQSAAPAGTAPAAVTSPNSGEVDQTNVPAHESQEAQSQSIAAAENQLETSTPDRTSANAEVPPDSQAPVAVEPPIAPLPAKEALTFLGVKPNIKDMTLDEKFACLKQCFAFGYGIRRIQIEVFESIVAEFKTYAKDRKGIPTVEEGFKQRGLNYKTIYSAIQREKERRTEDAKFFAEIKAQASTNYVHGFDPTGNDLPLVGQKVVVADGRRAVVLTHSTKHAPGDEPSLEIVYEGDGTSEVRKAGSLVPLADVLDAKKAVAKQGKKKNSKSQEEAQTRRNAAAVAKTDAGALSDSFYAAQYFNLVSLVNPAPKEMTPAEFAQTITENLQAAYNEMPAADAKRIKPAPNLFPTIAQGNENKLFMFLSADAVGTKSLINAVFGGIDRASFRKHLTKFAQRIADKFYDGKYKVAITEETKPLLPETEATVAPPLEPGQPPVTKVGEKSAPTPSGYYWMFSKREKPYSIYKVGNEKALGILCECRSRADAELKIASYERDHARGSPQPESGELHETLHKEAVLA